MKYSQEIDRAVRAHRKSLEGIWATLSKVRASSALSTEERDQALELLYAPLSSKDIRQEFVSDGRKFDIGVSFRSSMSNMIRMKSRLRAHGWNLAPGGNDKAKDARFARRVGVPSPRAIAEGLEAAEVTLVPGTIIKPQEGADARGVFYVSSDCLLRSVRTGVVYDSLASASSEYAKALHSREPIKWSIEEAVLDGEGRLAPDLKVYMFYGKPAMFLEIRRGAGGVGRDVFAGYDAQGIPMPVSPKRDTEGQLGVPADVAPKAIAVSENSPVPFLRVDFLAGASECQLGEITPHPGGIYAGGLFEDLDRRLGECFLDAEARLLIDLLNGKRFSDYFDVYDPS